jgi:hypothetical protein
MHRIKQLNLACPARNTIRLPILALLLACLSPLTSGAAEADNSIVTDRPDFVESSAVVGRGRFQIETSVAVERNKADGIKERTTATPTLLRFGVGDALELRLETDGRVVYKTDNAPTERGYGDLSLGVKWHALDAAGSAPSVGVLAHVDIDSGSSQFRGNGNRPSLRVVAEWELPNNMSLGVMPGIVYDKNADGGRFVAGILGVVVGKSWTEKARTFIEVGMPQIARGKNGATVANLNLGAAYLLSDTLQIDTALARGLNHRTADLSLTVGLSAKF